MLKGRQRYGASAPRTPRRSTSRAPHRSIAPPEVGIIPGNRFFLLPLKKVSALVRQHDPCRGSSATATKTCIETKGATNRAMTGNAGNNTDTSMRSANRLIVRGSVKQRRRHAAIARTHLGPISEQDEGKSPLLDDQGNWPWLWNQGTGSGRIRKLHRERDENAPRVNTQIYYRKPGRQEELNPRRFRGKIAAEPFERVLPRGASAVGYLSLVMVESAQQSAQQSAHVVSTGLNSRAAVVTKCNSSTGEWSQNRWTSKHTSVFNLDLRAQQEVEICHKFGSQGARESPLPVWPSDGLTPRRGARVAKTRFSTESESIANHAATTLKQEGMVSCEQLRTVDGQPRRKACRKLRKLVVLPRMQAFGRNRISPSDHQILFPTDPLSKQNFIQVGVGDRFGRSHEVTSKRCNSGRVRCRDEENSSVGCSGVHQTGSTWRSPFLCSLANEDDLPIGPLRGSLKEQLPLK